MFSKQSEYDFMKIINLIFLLGLTACVNQQLAVNEPPHWSEKDSSGVGFSIQWVKLKKAKLDALVSITNEYPFEVVLPENSIQCSLDGERNYSERTNRQIILPPHAKRVFIPTFQFQSSPREGNVLECVAQHVHKGEESTSHQTDSYAVGVAHGVGSATTYGNKAYGHSSAVAVSHGHSETKEILTYKAGAKLPEVAIKIDLFALKSRAPSSTK